MTHVRSSVTRCNGNSISLSRYFKGTTHHIVFIVFLLSITGFLFTGCQKESSSVPPIVEQTMAQTAGRTNGDALNQYTGLSSQTAWELQQARAASAKYLNIENARRDGYEDIEVVVPEMGHHFMKLSHVDINFDFRKPELLVYNRNHDGKMELVAVEYAVPIELTPVNAPEGFSGSADVWDRNTVFGLWLLHAWVWSYNPEGVFNPTNPLVHLH